MAIEHTTRSPLLPYQLEYTTGHRVDVITTLVAPILLAVALGLSIHFGFHPIPSMVHTVGNFYISIPLLFCTFVGTVCATIIIVQIYRHKDVNTAFAQFLGDLFKNTSLLPSLFRMALHPGGRSNHVTTEQYRTEFAPVINELKQKMGAQEVELKTRDGVQLSGYLFERCPTSPIVIFFHHNYCDAVHCWPFAFMYARANCSILLVEYRGYGLSDGKAAGPNAEIEAYYDAEAALHFVLQEGYLLDNVIAHGFSLGGAYAAALGYFFHVPNVILHCAFTRFAEVGSRASVVGSLETVEALIAASYTSQNEYPPLIKNSRPLQADGFNNVAKVHAMESHLIVIDHENDWLTPGSVTQTLVAARPIHKRAPTVITVPKARHDPKPFLENNEVKLQLMQFLVNERLLDRRYVDSYERFLKTKLNAAL